MFTMIPRRGSVYAHVLFGGSLNRLDVGHEFGTLTIFFFVPGK